MIYSFQEIQEKENTDLIGSFQHGFKKNFSTETSCLEIKTKLSNACDNGVLFILPLAEITAPTTYADDKQSVAVKRQRKKQWNTCQIVSKELFDAGFKWFVLAHFLTVGNVVRSIILSFFFFFL